MRTESSGRMRLGVDRRADVTRGERYSLEQRRGRSTCGDGQGLSGLMRVADEWQKDANGGNLGI